MFIELTPAEQIFARELAANRTASARAGGQVNMKGSGQSQEQVELEGVGAELAFCKLMNIYPDTGSGPRPEDCHLLDGRRVDVKATQHEHGQLVAARWKKPGAVHVYVLMVGTFPTYRCAGFYPSDALLTDERLTELNNRLVYAAGQHELDSIEALLGD